MAVGQQLTTFLLIENSFDMFKSPLGTWIPLMLIFLSTFITGLVMKKRGWDRG
jgi:hypothetical protein